MGLKNKVMRGLTGAARSAVENANSTVARMSGDACLDRIEEVEYMVHNLAASVLFSRWLHAPNALGSRKEAGYWLNSLGLTGEGVEVGVFKGEFSRFLLQTWHCTGLTSIDPWREFLSSEYVDACNLSQAEHDENFNGTVERLRRFGRRSTILRSTSREAAARFTEGSLDFVYLDAQHHYEAVRADIEIWHPKVKSGGVLGGHDYLDGMLASGLYGVKRAVDEFAAANGYPIVVTGERDWPSWFVVVG